MRKITTPQDQYTYGINCIELYLKRIRKINSPHYLEKLDKLYPLYLQGIEWLEKAVKQNYAPAQNKLGSEYAFLLRTSRNFKRNKIHCTKKALKLFRDAAEQDYALAQMNLGRKLLTSPVNKEDSLEGLKWLHNSAKQGDIDAMFFIGQAHSCWRDRKNYKKAILWYKKAAIKGHSYAQNRLADMYRYGQGVKKNYLKALELYKLAERKKVPDATMSIAEMYVQGLGVKINYLQARKWYEKATTYGAYNYKAKLWLGWFYEQGLGVKRDYFKARNCYEEALKDCELLFPESTAEIKQRIAQLPPKN